MKDQRNPIGRPQGEHNPRRVRVCGRHRHRELAENAAQHDLVLRHSEVPPNAYPTPEPEGQVPHPMLATTVEALFEPLRPKLIHVFAPKGFVVVHSHNIDPHVSSLGDNNISDCNVFSGLPLGIRCWGVQSKDLVEHPFHLHKIERELVKREEKNITDHTSSTHVHMCILIGMATNMIVILCVMDLDMHLIICDLTVIRDMDMLVSTIYRVMTLLIE